MPTDVRLSLSPFSLALLRIDSGLLRRSQIASAAWEPLEASTERVSGWSAAIDALPGLLDRVNVRGGRASVVLSNHFVRYLVVPASDELATQREEAGYARARFAQIHGETAREWTLRISREPDGSSRLAAAVDPGLLDALKGALQARRIRFASCRPALTAIMDAARAAIDDEAWVVVAERGRVAIASVSAGQWASVRCLPLQGRPVMLRELVAQERILEPGAGSDRPVFYSATDDVRVDAAGMPARLLPAGDRIELAPEARARVMLAMAGMP
jgi:hypothetical protein